MPDSSNQTPSLNPSPTGSSATNKLVTDESFAQGEQFLTDKFHKFAFKADSLYNSDVYKKLRPENKKKVDDAVYNSYAKVLKFMDRSAPGKAWWDAQKPADRLAHIKNTPSPGESPQGLMGHLESDMPLTWKEQWDITKKSVQKGSVDLAWGTSKTMEAFLRSEIEGQRLGEFNKRLGTNYTLDDVKAGKVQGFLSPTGEAGERFLTKLGSYFDEEKAYMDAKFKTVEPDLNRNLAAKLSSDTLTFVPSMVAISLLSEAGVGGSGLLKTAGLTDFLGTVKGGQIALRATSAALDGYEVAKMHGESGKEAAQTTLGWGAFELGAGALVESVGVLSGAAGSMYSKLAGIYGKKFVTQSVQHAMTNPEFSGVFINDPTIRKLNETNAKVLNDFTRATFGKEKLYQFLPKEQKAEINEAVNKAIQDGYRYPAAFDRMSVAKEVERSNAAMAKVDPEMAATTKNLRDMTVKTTGSPIQKGAVDTIQKETRDAAGINPSKEQKFNGISKSKSAEEVVAELTKTQPSKLARTETEKLEGLKQDITQKIKAAPSVSAVDDLVTKLNPDYRPGAAHFYDPSFTEQTLTKAMSLRPYFEDAEDLNALAYWQATNGRIRDPKLAKKIIETYQAAHPDPEWRAGKEAGLIEHAHKLFSLDYLNRFSGEQEEGKLGHVFRSGNYMTDELREKYGLPKTEWQEELDKEYNSYLKKLEKQRKKDYIPKALSKFRQETLSLGKAPSTSIQKEFLAEYRKLSSGEHVVYLDARAMSLMQLAFHDDPANLPLGFSLSPRDFRVTMNLMSDLSDRIPSGSLKMRYAFDKLEKVLQKAQSSLGPNDYAGVAFALTHELDKSPEGASPIKYSDIVKTLREEFNHGWQREIGKGSTLKHLDATEFDNLHLSLPAMARLNLIMGGYSNEKEVLVIEAAAKIMSGIHEEDMGMSDEDAATWLSEYFDTVSQKHGGEALSSIKHVMGISRKVLSEAKVRATSATRFGEKLSGLEGTQ